MPYTTLFFDLDDTLYASGNGLWSAIRERMSLYMYERLGLPQAEIPGLRRHYYETYGTTLRGLQKHFNVDADEYLAYVHDLPLSQYIQADPELVILLDGLKQSKWIFTNADDAHARRVLATLQLNNCFHGIVDVRAMQFHCKPEPESFQIAMQLAGEDDPQRCLMLDDSPANLAPARALGFGTVLVGRNGDDLQADYSITRLNELRSVLPELWEA